MSSLSRFVQSSQRGQQNPGNPPTQPLRPDRIEAQKYKISKRASSFAAKEPAAGQAPSYVAQQPHSNQHYSYMNGNQHGNPEPEPHQYSPHRGAHAQNSARGLDQESTINSDFDRTVTGLTSEQQGYINEDDYDGGDQGDEEDDEEEDAGRGQPLGSEQREHILHRTAIQSQLPHLSEEDMSQVIRDGPAATISGRFSKSQHQPLPERCGAFEAIPTNHGNAFRKRSRSAERIHGEGQQETVPRGNFMEGGFDADEYDGQSSLGRPLADHTRGRQLGHYIQETDAQGYLLPEQNPQIPDYDDDQLRSMTYSDLAAEAWDHDPRRKELVYPEYLQGDIPLGEKIEYHVKNPNQHKDAPLDEYPRDCQKFFEQLSTKEWEEAGDWFIEKFASILKDVKDKRKEKREVMEKFEREIDAREKAVRGKSGGFERKFNDMRQSGQHVLRGKTS